MANDSVDISGIHEITERLANQKEVVARSEEFLRSQMDRIKQRVIDGESTGDKFQDIVIRDFGVIDDGLRKKYADLEARLAGRKGEFILIEFTSSVMHRHVFGKGRENRDQNFFRIGVLEGEALVFCKLGYGGRNEESALPVSRFITRPVGHFSRKEPRLLEVTAGNIFADVFVPGYGNDSNPPSLRVHFAPPSPHEFFVRHKNLEIVIGDADVQNWSKAQLMEDFYRAAADSLSKLILTPTEP